MEETFHLAKGSLRPALQKGVMRLYGMRFCPFAQRCLLVINARGINCDVVNVNTAEKPEWLIELNPNEEVPVLEFDNGRVFCESLTISEVLDGMEEAKGETLQSCDPLTRAKDHLLTEQFKSVINPFFKLLLSCAGSEPDIQLFDLLQVNLDKYETELRKRESEFFGGDTAGMLDYMIWPFFERIEQFVIFRGENLRLPADRFPKLTVWVDKMKSVEAVQMCLLPPEVHAQFSKNVFFEGGSCDFDFLARGHQQVK